jgi:hypothetical protein
MPVLAAQLCLANGLYMLLEECLPPLEVLVRQVTLDLSRYEQNKKRHAPALGCPLGKPFQLFNAHPIHMVKPNAEKEPIQYSVSSSFILAQACLPVCPRHLTSDTEPSD